MMKINKKIKAFMSIIMACFMCVGVLLSIKTDVYADSSKEYVYDNAGILTSDEVSKLKSQCKKASEDSECDIVIITTNIGHDGSTMDSYLKKFLDDISQGTIDDIREACEEKLSDKAYYKAFSKYVKNMNMCMTTSVVKKLTYKMWIKLLIASGVAVAAVLTMMHNAKARMTVSSTEYTKDHNFKVNDRRDVFINTTVVTRHIEHNNSSGSSGGGGGNSGSGGHF